MSAGDGDLDRLLAACLERLEQEGTAALDAACAAHPELAARLRRRVSLLASANLLELSPGLEGLPELLGDFEPRERLGEGAMAVVHRARQVSTGREVALKLVRPEQLVFSGARARFRREVELSARLHHPAILPVLAVGETQGLPWFALELVHGASLSALLARLRARFGQAARVDPAALPGALREATPEALRGAALAAAPRSHREWGLRVALAVARALAHAHEKGVLHRDVKPSNVMLGADGRVFLTDFGLAGEPGEGSLTGSRSAVGSLPYMAPEVLEGERCDVRSDVYGVGALAYEVLTLRRPFEAPSSAALVRAILAGEPEAPRRLAPALGADEEAVLLRALERDPARRYPTARELAEDLEHLLARRPTRARPAGPWLRARRFVERRPAASAALALALLLFAGTPSAVAWSEARARRRVEEANAALDLALGRERDERARADQNLERATRAVHVLLTETGGRLLDEVPHMQQLKRDLLERALAVLAELEPQAPDEPARVLQGAAVDLAAGTARVELSELAAAREHLERGLARLDACPGCTALDAPRALDLRVRLLGQLGRLEERDGRAADSERAARAILTLTEGAPEPELAQERLLALLRLHDLAYFAGRKEDARAWVDQADELVRLRGAEWPPEEALYHRAQVRGTRGMQLYMDNADQAAAADMRDALAALAELLALDPERLPARRNALSIGINLAAAEMRLGELAEAEATLARARAHGEDLVRLFPGAPDFRSDLAGLLINLGLLRGRQGDAAGCREAWEASAAAGRLLAADPEATGDELFQAGLSLTNLASLEHDEGRCDAAVAVAREAEGALRRVVAEAPGHVVAARSLEFSLLTRGYCELSLGRPEEFRSLLEAAEEAAPEERLAQRALTDGWLTLAAALPEEERAPCHARALSTLQRAVALGWDNADDLARNELLDPLRELPGFPSAP